MAERRRFKRIPVYLRIKEIDQNPKSDGTLVNISALGAQIETTTKYRCGNLIKFSYIPSGPSLNDLEIQERGGAIWNIPADMFREELLSGKVVWVAPHPDKPNHFLMGIKFSPKKRNGRRIIFSLIVPIIMVAAGVAIATQGPLPLFDYKISILEWFSSLLEAIRIALSKLLPF